MTFDSQTGVESSHDAAYKSAPTNGYERRNGHVNGATNGRVSGHASGNSNGQTNGHRHDLKGPSLPSAATVPIAIVGMSCRFSGGASNPEKLWKLVSEGRSTWSEIPASRFNGDAFYHPHAEKLGTAPVKGGYFLEEDISLFDSSFFGYSAEVAATMDPQIRMQLELVYEALESAGIPMSKIAGTNTSAFAGTFTRDYNDLLMRDPMTVPRNFLTGNFTAMVANRISHFFDLRGPSTPVDTGCSTSLVALHLACQSLRTGESDCSIVGGSCVMTNPDIFAQLSSLGFLGPDGKCYSFDHRAQGYGRGEGVATLILKRLDQAIKDNDPIRAVIRETGINQDGKTLTITSPSGEAQEALMRECYEKAGLDPLNTTYVEAHGTGTKTGDPIETSRIGSVFGRPSIVGQPLFIGSIKSNIGHTEAASGLASILKVAMALEHAKIPPSINFENPNPEINFTKLGLQVARKLETWPECDVRRASINNFGYSGTNTHVIMEDASKYQLVRPADLSRPQHRNVFVLSAKDEKSAVSMMANLRSYLTTNLENDRNIGFSDLAYTLDQRRTRFPWSVATSAATVEELVDNLADKTLKPVNASSVPRLGFVFNGQGAQWHAMGRELMQTYPVYHDTLVEADAIVKGFGSPWSIIEELSRDPEDARVDGVTFSFPLSCVVQLGLVRLLESWGVRPTAVTGHSSGEVAAAFAAGALNLKEAMAITYFRGFLTAQYVKTATVPGAMLAVGLGPEEVSPYLKAKLPGKAVLACVNSPSSVTLSGDKSAIDELAMKLTERSVFARRLKVESAFHSHHMLPIAEAYSKVLSEHLQMRGSVDNVLFSSPVTGGWISDVGELGPAHWVENMIKPVLFSQSLSTMIADTLQGAKQNVDLLVEIGPHGALGGPIRQITTSADLKHTQVEYGSCLTRGVDAVKTVQELAALLWRKGAIIDLEKVNFPTGQTGARTIHDLPAYSWNHSAKFWIEPRASRDYRFRKHAWHDLLGVRVPGTTPFAPVWRNIIKPANVPWIRDHEVQSDIVYPGAGCIAMAIEAIRQYALDEGKPVLGYSLRDVQISRALVVPESAEGIEVQLVLSTADDKALTDGWRQFRIYSALPTGDWAENCSGYILAETEAVHSKPMPLGDFSFDTNIEPETLFKTLHQVGVHHGPAFQNLQSIQAGNDSSEALFKISDVATLMPAGYQSPHVIHPITLDAVFQAAYSVLSEEKRAKVGAAVPRSIDNLYISDEIVRAPESVFKAVSELVSIDAQGFNVQMAVAPVKSSSTHLQITGMRYQSLGLAAENEDQPQPDLCLTVGWEQSLDFGHYKDIAETLKRPSDADEKSIGEDLTRATYHLVHDILAELTEEDIANLEWHHATWLDWMRHIEEQAASNKLAPRSSRWAKSSEGVKQMLFDRVASQSVNGEMLMRLGKHNLQIMRKQVAPLDIMMEGNLLYKFYREMLHFTTSISQAVELLKIYSRQNPHANILEIGAGTGSCTGPALRALGGNDPNSKPRFAHYTFTDISSGFFEEARKNFAEWGDLVSYQPFDAEKSPEAQSVQLGTYDVVIACLVLHATKDMDNTMKNVRSLLKPGGKLLLVETTQDSIDVNMIFGPLPGWWLSQEPERKYSPNLTLEMWESVLGRTGFSGIDLDVWDCEDSTHHSMSAIMSTAITQQKALPKKVSLVYSAKFPATEWLKALQTVFQSAFGFSPSVEALETLDARGKTCIFVSEIDNPVLSAMTDVEFEAVKSMIGNCKGLLWVTRGGSVNCTNPDLALHSGLLRVRRLENASQKYITLDLDPGHEPFTTQSAVAISECFGRAFDESQEASITDFEYALRDSKILVPRVNFNKAETQETLNLDNRPAEPLALEQSDRELRMFVEEPGSLDSIVFKTDPDGGKPLPADYVEIAGKAFGLNFRDIMVAMGQLKEKNMGFECGGIVTRVGSSVKDFKVGDRVCALTSHGHWASRSRVPETSVARIPDWMDYETAASIPMVFLTAYYSLFEAGQLAKGEKVLIHAASGGVGQAAIILAQLRGAEVFATVSNQEKRDFIKATYGLADDHIFSSRSTSFASHIKAATGGRGVNLVLNSLAGKLLNESWNCLDYYGRFVEIGKKDIQQNKRLEMEPLSKAISFIAFDLIHLSDYKPAVVSRMLKEILTLLSEARIKTIAPIKVSPISDIVRAFRRMQAGKHVGKIVLSIGQNDLVPAVPQQKITKLLPDASYLLVGGVGGIGRSLAKRFVDHGAKHLILLSRSAATKPESQELIDILGRQGCKVLVKNCDVANPLNLAAVIKDCTKSMPPVRGIIQGAMVLQDSIWERMDHAKWLAAVAPKVAGTRNLHNQFGDSLDFFVTLSSIAAVIGNASQANYAAGGTYQDALIQHRTALGLPAVGINLGMVDSVGYVAENKELGARLLRDGHRALSETEVLDLVAAAIRKPRRTRDTCQIVTGLLPVESEHYDAVGWRADPRFRALRQTRQTGRGSGQTNGAASNGATLSLREQITRAESDTDALEAVIRGIIARLSVMFAIPEADIDAELPLSKYGVDSLVAVELRNWLVGSARSEVSIFDVLGSGSLKDLAARVLERSKASK